MIVTNKKQFYNLQPKTIEDEILQNICVILNTYKGTVPLNRKLGVDISFIDTPSNLGLIKSKMLIAEAIQKYEPRASVTKVVLNKALGNDMEGDFNIEVEVDILDEFK